MSIFRKQLLIVISILVAACSGAAETNTNNDAAIDNGPWIREWLENPACEPPCFEGIIPGGLKHCEAMGEVEANPDNLVTYEDGRRYEFEIHFENTVTRDTGIVTSRDLDDGEITVQLADDHSISMAQIIEKFGEPDGVYFQSCSQDAGPVECGIEAVYIQGQMSFSLRWEGFGAGRATLEDRSVFGGITMRSKELDTLALQETGELLPWDGYGVYEVGD